MRIQLFKRGPRLKRFNEKVGKPKPGSLEYYLDECCKRAKPCGLLERLRAFLGLGSWPKRVGGVLRGMRMWSIWVMSSGLTNQAAEILRCLTTDNGQVYIKAVAVEKVPEGYELNRCYCISELEETHVCLRRIIYVSWGGRLCQLEIEIGM